ncbi:permease-like cell division protein FtsX, partial [Neisseria gonorrhoeae]
MSIIHYFSLHVESARSALKQLLRQPFGTLLTLIMLAVAMTLPLFMYLGIQSGQSVLGKLNESPQITVYMETAAAQSDSDTVRSLLTRDKRLDNIRFIGKEDGLAELQSNLDQNLISMLDGNPLPDVFIVTPDPATTPAQMQAIYRDITKLPMVESASMDTEWVQTLYQINEFIRKILWFLSLTLGMAFVLVAHNTIRLQILSRKEEIEITKLLGAPASFIRRPFLYQAMWQSIFSAAVSLGLCGWLLSAVHPLVDAIFKPYGLNIGWRFF